MTGLWLVSYVILWILVIGAGLVILALSREVEALHKRFDSLHKYVSDSTFGVDRRQIQSARDQADPPPGIDTLFPPGPTDLMP